MAQESDPKAAVRRFYDDLAPRWAANPPAPALAPFVERLGC